jgi:hypothetical protein
MRFALKRAEMDFPAALKGNRWLQQDNLTTGAASN